MAMTWIYKHGAQGKVLTGTLSDANGPVDLTNKTVVMSARRTTAADPVLNNVSITKVDAANGVISWTVTADAANADNVAENLKGYLMEFKVSEGSTVDYFPTSADGTRMYAKLIVQKNLD